MFSNTFVINNLQDGMKWVMTTVGKGKKKWTNVCQHLVGNANININASTYCLFVQSIVTPLFMSMYIICCKHGSVLRLGLLPSISVRCMHDTICNPILSSYTFAYVCWPNMNIYFHVIRFVICLRNAFIQRLLLNIFHCALFWDSPQFVRQPRGKR